MSWRVGLANLLYHSTHECILSNVSLPRQISSIVRQSIAREARQNIFVDGTQSPLIAIINKCMRTNHLQNQTKVCTSILSYFSKRPQIYSLTAAEDHLVKLFRANLDLDDNESISVDDIDKALGTSAHISSEITEDKYIQAEAFYAIRYNWGKALHAFIELSKSSNKSSRDYPMLVKSPPLRLLQLWAMQNPRARWRSSLTAIESLPSQQRTFHHAIAQNLLHALGALAWEVWNIHAGTFNRNMPAAKIKNYAIGILPRWQDRWIAAISAFDIITKNRKTLNYDIIDFSQVLWTKLGESPQTPHLYARAAMRQQLVSPDPWRLARIIRSVWSLPDFIRVFENVDCSAEVISFILLELSSLYHIKKHRIRFSTKIGTDCLLECMLPQIKKFRARESVLFDIWRRRGIRMDGEPIYSIETRLFLGQEFVVDFSVLDASKCPLRLTSELSRSTRCFFDATQTISNDSTASVQLKRDEVHFYTTSFNRIKEALGEGFPVIYFCERPSAFFHHLPSETTLAKVLMPSEARMHHPMSWDDILPEEERTYHVLASDGEIEPAAHVYAVKVRSTSSSNFTYRHQMMSIRRWFPENGLFIVGDHEMSGPHMTCPVAEKPLIALKEQRFRSLRTGAKVIFETVNVVDISRAKCGIENDRPITDVHVPM